MIAELPAALRRQLAALLACAGLIAVAGTLGAIALAGFAVALHLYLTPRMGAELAALSAAALFLAAALLIAALAYARARRWPRPIAADPVQEPPQTPREGMPYLTQQHLARHITTLVSEALPRHAVPATLIALVGGIAVGLNPRAAQHLMAMLNAEPGGPAARAEADRRRVAPSTVESTAAAGRAAAAE